jgi:hypothetical protein
MLGRLLSKGIDTALFGTMELKMWETLSELEVFMRLYFGANVGIVAQSDWTRK